MGEIRRTIKKSLRWGIGHLKDSGVDNPRLDADVLLAHCLDIERVKLCVYNDKILDGREWEKYRKCIERRSKSEPVAYITECKEFHSLKFRITKEVLIPRPETEILVEEVLKEYSSLKENNDSLRILELGTGSGIIAVSLAKEVKNLNIMATDISPGIIKIASDNARLHKVDDKINFFVGRFLEAIKEKRNQFDFIVSNPPYLSESDWENAQTEIKEYEPQDSLLGGDDGLDFYRTILPDVITLLRNDGYLMLEVGVGQADKVSDMIRKTAKYRKLEQIKDLSGIPRLVKVQK